MVEETFYVANDMNKLSFLLNEFYTEDNPPLPKKKKHITTNFRTVNNT